MGLFRKSKKEKNGARGAQGADGTVEMTETTPRPSEVETVNAMQPMSAADAGTTVDQVSQSVIDGFTYGVPYLRLNTSILVACHSEAAMSSNLFSEEASVVYSDLCYHDLQDPAARDRLDPHVFELVADAYAHVRRLRQDQAIVLSGLSGSGKSETAKLISDQLCVLASNGGRHSTRAQHQMAFVGAVVEAFACAQTRESLGATRVGLWQECQFGERGR
ncbi:hypothetical protein FB639_004677, partial [Coemansia asiatica]